MINLPINNHNDLKNEILRLQGLEREQRIAIKQRFSSPGALFSTVFSLFGKGGNQFGDKDGSIFNQDFLGVISRFILPFTLNKTIFRNSNFLVKALVGLVSQKASHYISEDSVEGVWDKAKGLFGKVSHLFDKSAKKKTPEVTSFRKIKKD
ncbi:hypothetical protein [Mucilaginibacter sp.]|uniref:hypothetical protein n=1 Tax=Mucilaginibacter sp. TaxID=1882438 RepID=UPI002619E8D1|nr:hypothetical protein [Mucilaginibacter sp.]MDB5030192.1 hypothetical protein [Mucilaginibacter sp.]